MNYLTKEQLISQCSKILLEKDWSDYFLLVGVSDAWIPYMVITLLQDVKNKELQKKRRDIFKRLNDIDKNKAIGYNRRSPNDCDSSIWYARAIISLEQKPSDKLISYIRSHQAPNGKFSTYNLEDNIHKFIRYSEEDIYPWLKPHDCVSMNGESLFNELRYGPSNKTPGKFKNFSQFKPYWWADKRIPILMCNKKIQKKILDNINLKAEELVPVDILDKWPEYKYFSIILTYMLQLNSKKNTLFPENLPNQTINYSKCIMQIPDPKLKIQKDWNYSGLVQGARVEDINKILTSALIISNLTTTDNNY